MTKVRYIHLRDYTSSEETPDARGGATIAYRTAGDVTHYAISECHPKDNFNKAIGRIKAEGKLSSSRLCKSLETTGNRNIEICYLLRGLYYQEKCKAWPAVNVFRY